MSEQTKSVQVFDFVKSINTSKQDIMTDENEKIYNPFLINTSFSLYKDSIFLANEMNCKYNLSIRMQYDFYLYGLSKRNRFTQWPKKENIEHLDMIKEYYQYSESKALEVLSLLNEEQLSIIKEKLDKGGRR